jgi:hypothetical protein
MEKVSSVMNCISKSTANGILLSLGVSAIAAALFIPAIAQPASAKEARRPLNPGPGISGENKSSDRAFRIAFEAANAGDFDTAVINYGRASLAVRDPCDKAHALSGQVAAMEAKALPRSAGGQSNRSQFFWIRIQELTQGLPCVWVR